MPDVSQIIREISVFAIPLLLALTCHEVAHGYVAYLLGDPTAKNAGRLTLNPLKHLDPIGTIIFFVAKIGWAKPVPVDPRHFKDPQRGMLLVALAGPATNFILAVLFAILYKALLRVPVPEEHSLVFNLLWAAAAMSQAGVFVNLILGVFNLVPIPPLDGANILAGFLPRRLAYKYLSFGRYGVLLILGLVVASNIFGLNILGALIFPVIEKAAELLQIQM